MKPRTLTKRPTAVKLALAATLLAAFDWPRRTPPSRRAAQPTRRRPRRRPERSLARRWMRRPRERRSRSSWPAARAIPSRPGRIPSAGSAAGATAWRLASRDREANRAGACGRRGPLRGDLAAHARHAGAIRERRRDSAGRRPVAREDGLPRLGPLRLDAFLRDGPRAGRAGSRRRRLGRRGLDRVRATALRGHLPRDASSSRPSRARSRACSAARGCSPT